MTARHVYMSSGPVRLTDGKPELPDGVVMKHRGPIAADHDPASFMKLMGSRGYLVRVVERYRGNDLTLDLLEG